MAAYVYGVVRAGVVETVTTPGVNADGGSVRLVEHDGLAALVSDVPDGPLTGTKDDVLAHSRVLEEVVGHVTVLPMRFGVVMDGEGAVRSDLLGRYAAQLKDLLTATDGHVQVRVRAFYRDDAALREIVAEDPSIARRRDALKGKPDDATYYDRIRLGEMIADALERKREHDAGELLTRLDPLAVDLAVEDPVHEQMVLNANLLVRREGLDGLLAEIERLQEGIEARIQIRAVGPLPPYSFVDLPDVAREESWA